MTTFILMNNIRDWFSVLQAKILAFMGPIADAEPIPDDQRSPREQLIARLLELQAQSNTATAARQQQIDAITVSIREAEADMNELYVELQRLRGQQMADSLNVGTEIDRLRAELTASAPPRLETFLAQVNMEIERAQHTLAMDGKIIDRLTTLRHVREQALTLQTAPIAMATVLTRLKQLEHTSGLVAVS